MGCPCGKDVFRADNPASEKGTMVPKSETKKEDAAENRVIADAEQDDEIEKRDVVIRVLVDTLETLVECRASCERCNVKDFCRFPKIRNLIKKAREVVK